MSSSIMCSKSCLAIQRWSGGSLQARAWTGGPVVWMWCVTVCLTGQGEVHGLITDGNSANMVSYSVLCSCGQEGLGKTMCEMVPLLCSEVVTSKNLPCFKFTSSSYSRRKSAPMISVWMSAMTKIQQNTHRRSKSKVRDHVPYVGIEEPLTARSPESC